jgi:hypothetical protein
MFTNSRRDHLEDGTTVTRVTIALCQFLSFNLRDDLGGFRPKYPGHLDQLEYLQTTLAGLELPNE